MTQTDSPHATLHSACPQPNCTTHSEGQCAGLSYIKLKLTRDRLRSFDFVRSFNFVRLISFVCGRQRWLRLISPSIAFMLVKKIAQQIQLGTRQIWIQYIFLNRNLQKYLILQTLQGSTKISIGGNPTIVRVLVQVMYNGRWMLQRPRRTLSRQLTKRLPTPIGLSAGRNTAGSSYIQWSEQSAGLDIYLLIP